MHEIHTPIHPTRIRTLPNGEQVDFGNGKNTRTGSKSPEVNENVSRKKNEKKSSKNKDSSDVDSVVLGEPLLPNGEKPNFSNDKKVKAKPKNKKKEKKKVELPTLPNGEKPNFGERSNEKKSKAAQLLQSLPNGDKPNFSSGKESYDKPSNDYGKKNKLEENYAGSSFHSSPAALNLPKPTFKSPKQVNDEASSPSVTPIVKSQVLSVQAAQVTQTAQNTQNLNVANIGIPHPPPQYPVTMYQPTPGQLNNPLAYNSHGHYIQQPGFTYQYNPQGYVQYQYPYQAPQQGPYGIVPLGVQPPIPNGQLPLPPHHPNHVHPMYALAPAKEQKITFSDLLGSVKK